MPLTMKAMKAMKAKLKAKPNMYKAFTNAVRLRRRVPETKVGDGRLVAEAAAAAAVCARVQYP